MLPESSVKDVPVAHCDFPYCYLTHMRIAVSGAHAVGKSTLVKALGLEWPEAILPDEAYYDLRALDHTFALELSALDFEEQLRHSLTLVQSSGTRPAIFDRSPADYLAYILALDPSSEIPARLLPSVTEAFNSLDLLVYVPIETPDRIGIADEHPKLRKRVDRLLRSALLDDAWGLGVQALEVTGTVLDRTAQVKARCAGLGRQ
jgi:hypothetical protein